MFVLCYSIDIYSENIVCLYHTENKLIIMQTSCKRDLLPRYSSPPPRYQMVVSLPSVEASTMARNPRYTPIKKSAQAKLQMRKRGTSILDRLRILTNKTQPLPSKASKKTIHTPHRRDHQPIRSSQGMNGPANIHHQNSATDSYPGGRLVGRCSIPLQWTTDYQVAGGINRPTQQLVLPF